MKTYLAPVNEIEKKWYVVDAENKVLGRLASEIAARLRGKHKPTFSTFIDNGDFIIVTNAEKIQLTGNKWDDKKYYRHTGYMGGLKEDSAQGTSRQAPDGPAAQCCQGHAAEKQLGPRPAEKTEGLYRRGASA